jgi:hypothetical protein
MTTSLPYPQTQIGFVRQVLLALDQFVNALLLGEADTSISARAYIRSKDGTVCWKVVRKLIDIVVFFQDDHCFRAYMYELEQKRSFVGRYSSRKYSNTL